MEYYRDLLLTVFGVSGGSCAPGVSAFSCVATHAAREHNPHLAQHLLPEGVEHIALPGGEEFFEALRSAAAAKCANTVLVCPPLAIDRTPVWKQKYGRTRMVEAITSLLMDGAIFRDGVPAAEWPLPDLFELAGDGRVDAGILAAPSGVARPQIDTLVLLIPHAELNRQETAQWRTTLLALRSVIVVQHHHEGVGALLGLHGCDHVEFTTLVVRRQPGPTRFVKITPGARRQGALRIASDLGRLMQQATGKAGFGYVCPRSVAAYDYCSYDAFSEETEALIGVVGSMGGTIPLEAAARILRGFAPGSRVERGHESTGCDHITRDNIHADGTVHLEPVRHRAEFVHVRLYLQAGDLCMREICAGDDSFVVGVCPAGDRPITFGPGVIVLRPPERLKPASREVLLEYLRSPLAYQIAKAMGCLNQVGEEWSRLSVSRLRSLPVPIVCRLDA